MNEAVRKVLKRLHYPIEVRFCCNKDFGLRRYAIDSELAGARRYR